MKLNCFGAEDTVCTFCTIKESLGTRLVAETDTLLAFHDRSPSAKLHLLVIPKKHIATVKDLNESHIGLLREMIELGSNLLKEQGYDPSDSTQVRLGFHVPPFNSVNHLHMHIIGLPFRNKLRSLKYKPGYPWYADAKTVLRRLVDGMSPI